MFVTFCRAQQHDAMQSHTESVISCHTKCAIVRPKLLQLMATLFLNIISSYFHCSYITLFKWHLYEYVSFALIYRPLFDGAMNFIILFIDKIVTFKATTFLHVVRDFVTRFIIIRYIKISKRQLRIIHDTLFNTKY